MDGVPKELIQEEGLFLSSNLQVLQADRNTPFERCSYVVIEVERDFHAQREWEIDQKVSKLVAELNGKGQSGKAALEFLRETFDAYDKFKKLERAQELKNRKLKADKSLSEAEKDKIISKDEIDLLKELTGDKALAPFLGN